MGGLRQTAVGLRSVPHGSAFDGANFQILVGKAPFEHRESRRQQTNGYIPCTFSAALQYDADPRVCYHMTGIYARCCKLSWVSPARRLLQHPIGYDCAATYVSSTRIPNTGSLARDCLAAERTFLAWARTGLGFVGAGTAVFATWPDEGVAPLLLMGNGAFLLAFATRRYLRVIEALQSSMFPLDTGHTIMAVAVTAVGTIAAAGRVAHSERKSFAVRSDGDNSNLGNPPEPSRKA